jgi:hypothetical protein
MSFFKSLGRKLSGATRWVGRQIKHAGQLQGKFLNTVNSGAKTLGRVVSKLPAGDKVVSAVRNVIDNAKVPFINKSIGDLYKTGQNFSKNVEGLGRSVNDLGYSMQTNDRQKQLASMRAVRDRAMNAKSTLQTLRK